ncbi:MAG: Glu/Leu/Phe/Val dehydrogenase [Terriglobales bacterium]
MTSNDFLPPQAVQFQEDLDPLLESTLEFEESARQLDLEEFILQRLRHMEREITVNLPLKREHGGVSSITGFRVQHHCGGAPTLGTLRLSPDANLSALRSAAMAMTWQLALLQIPFGGAAGAVVCNPEELSERELHALIRDYLHALRGIVGPFTDVVAPDAGCNPQTMAWMLDSYARAAGRTEPAVATGKPAVLWGLPDYYSAAAAGIMALLRHIAARQGSSIVGQRAAIQGFGTVGSSVARALYDSGARIVAVADLSGGLYNAAGINISELEAHATRKHVLFGFPEAEAVCNADVLEADCELLVLAAHERQIGATNAERIHAPLVIEATHAAVTHAAEEALSRQGVRIVPDLLANAGAVLAAFAEWKQNTALAPQMPGTLSDLVAGEIIRAYDLVHQAATKNNLRLRTAAFRIALERVASRIRLMSW